MSALPELTTCPACTPPMRVAPDTAPSNVLSTGGGAGGPADVPRPQPRELPAGTRLGDFELVRLLGRGGMGAVYEAVDHTLKRSVALKLLTSNGDGQAPEQVQRLVREARAVAQLDHPNIVSVYQVGCHDNLSFIAMQLVRGRSAAAWLREHGPLAPAEAARVIHEAAQGLAAVHAIGLIHRDVKPDNLLLGPNGVVKVADFGIARSQTVGELGPGTTGGIAGTPHYMSPEQVQGQALDARTDIYALGATWFCLLTGRPPFVGDAAFDVMSQQVYDPPPALTALQPNVPAAHARLIEQMLAKDPRARPKDGAEFLAALARLESGGTVPDKPAALPSRKPWGWLGGVGVVAGAILLNVVGAWVYHAFRSNTNLKAAPSPVVQGSDDGKRTAGVEPQLPALPIGLPFPLDLGLPPSFPAQPSPAAGCSNRPCQRSDSPPDVGPGLLGRWPAR